MPTLIIHVPDPANKMNLQDRLLFKENYFSWSRTAMLLRLYIPSLLGKLVVLSLLSLLLTVAMGAYAMAYHQRPPLIGFYLLSMLIMLAPLTIATKDFRDVGAQLPVTATEKTATLFIIYWLIFPAVMATAGWLGEIFSRLALGVDLDVYVMDNYQNHFHWMLIAGCIQMIAVVTITLYYIVTASGNRILTGLVACVAGYIATLLTAGLIFFIIGFVVGIQVAAGTAEAEMVQIINNKIVGFLPLAIGFQVVLALIAIIYFTYKIHKSLNIRGF